LKKMSKSVKVPISEWNELKRSYAYLKAKIADLEKRLKKA